MGSNDAVSHIPVIVGRRQPADSKTLFTLSQKSATVAESGETTAKFGDCPHFSATVWTGFKKMSHDCRTRTMMTVTVLLRHTF